MPPWQLAHPGPEHSSNANGHGEEERKKTNDCKPSLHCYEDTLLVADPPFRIVERFWLIDSKYTCMLRTEKRGCSGFPRREYVWDEKKNPSDCKLDLLGLRYR